MIKCRLWQYAFCWVLLFCSFSVKAQYILEGKVVNSQNEFVANASIKIKDSANGLPRFFSISNEQGFYHISIPDKSKTYWLQCSLLGYRNSVFRLPMPIGNIVHLDIKLIPDTARLPEINVYSIPPVTVSGDTTSFRVDAFKKGNESNVGDLLNVLPGFSVNNGRITYNGKSVTKVLIEEDDLFGSDYNSITQNLSPKGIEKIQLIENYNDKTYLSNRLKRGDELVVNLKFNKKYLSRIITSNEAGISFSPFCNFYKIRQNIISLIPKIKSVTTNNFNNTGLLAAEIMGNRINLPELEIYKKDGINFDFSPRFAASPIAQMPDMVSAIIPKNRMVSNYSSVVTNNTLYKPSKIVQLKGILQYCRDNYSQQQLQTTDYSVSGGNLLVQNKQFLQKKIPVLNGSIETVYSPSNYTQFLYKVNIITQNETDSLNDVRQLLETYAKNKSTFLRFQQQLGFSFSIDSSRVIDIRAFQNSVSSNEIPIIFPAYLYSAFTADTVFNILQSSIQNESSEYNFQAKLTCRKKITNWSIELLHSISQSHLKSGISLLKPDSLFKLTDISLLNDAALKTRISTLMVTYNASLTSNISLRTTQRIEMGQIFFTNFFQLPEKTYIHYLPSVKLGFSLNKKSRLDLYADLKNKLPQIYNLTEGFLFSNDNTILQGTNSLQIGISKSLSLSYSYTEMIKRKLIFASSLFYSRDPLIYLTNTIPSAYYTINQTSLYGKDMRLMGFSAIVSKYLSAWKSQAGLELYANQIASFYSVNNKIGTLNLSSIITTFKFKTLLTDKLTSNISAKSVISYQDFDKGLRTENQNEIIALTATAELLYKFNGKWSMSTKYQNINQKKGAQSNSVEIADVFVKYIAIKDKLSFMMSGNNLLSKGQFTSVSFTQNSINTQTLFLIRPFWMLHITLEL
jgi:hypothetical protein